MGTENKKRKKRTHSCVRREIIISRVLLGTKFNCTEAETIPLFYLKFILAENWARLNSFISGFTPYENMSFFKKHGDN